MLLLLVERKHRPRCLHRTRYLSCSLGCNTRLFSASTRCFLIAGSRPDPVQGWHARDDFPQTSAAPTPISMVCERSRSRSQGPRCPKDASRTTTTILDRMELCWNAAKSSWLPDPCCQVPHAQDDLKLLARESGEHATTRSADAAATTASRCQRRELLLTGLPTPAMAANRITHWCDKLGAAMSANADVGTGQGGAFKLERPFSKIGNVCPTNSDVIGGQ
eukprot:scpid20787/ scgid27350/ 